MPRPDGAERLRDIVEAVTDTMNFVAGMTPEIFDALPENDRRTYRAIKNAVSEIGEAVKGLPSEVCDRHPDIDWRGIAGLRDIVVHTYFAVDLPRLWPVLTEEFPALLKAAKTELGEADPPPPGGSGPSP
jgi:uncharacterized protein with HEPN domain